MRPANGRSDAHERMGMDGGARGGKGTRLGNPGK
jgi:hypothetical protein